mgnify:CR=1 FL=1
MDKCFLMLYKYMIFLHGKAGRKSRFRKMASNKKSLHPGSSFLFLYDRLLYAFFLIEKRDRFDRFFSFNFPCIA